MTENEKHAAVGRVLTEKREAEVHLAHLRTEAKRLGEILESLGKMLKERPDTVRFDGQSVNAIYSARTDERSFPTEQIDGRTLVKLTTEIRDTMDKVDSLTRQARDFGF